jgi:hypothetical protein
MSNGAKRRLRSGVGCCSGSNTPPRRFAPTLPLEGRVATNDQKNPSFFGL